MCTCGHCGGMPLYDVVKVLGSEDLHLIPCLADALEKTDSPTLEILCGEGGLIIAQPEHLLELRLTDLQRSVAVLGLCADCMAMALGQTVLSLDDITPFDIGASS